MIRCIAAVILLVRLSSGAPVVTILSSPQGQSHEAAVVDQAGMPWVALPDIFEALGFTWTWDEAGQQFSAQRNADRFIFWRDVSWYSRNDELCGMETAPQRFGAELYCPLSLLPAIARSVAGEGVTWDSTRRILAVKAPGFGISSVSWERARGADHWTITLPDSVRCEHSFERLRLEIRFPGATMDTASINRIRAAGFVDSIAALQTKESAILRMTLSPKAGEPLIDLLEDQSQLLVTIPPRDAAPAPGATPPSTPAVNGGIKTIVIDPGHGGKDPGAIGPGGTREKDIVLRIALELRDLFKQHKDIRIFLTREHDVFIPLAERTRMANERNADLFVSIHANATGGSKKKKETTTGYKVYFLSQAKNEEDKLAAMRENAVIELEEKRENYSSLQNVLIDLAGNEYLRESQELSILLDQKFESALKRKVSRQAKGIGQANFWVLNGAYMPSILIETGFISNRAEEKMLLSKQFQKQMAGAIFEALIAFKKKYETGL